MRWRQLCLAEQKIRAARYAAELAEWQATGGDFLCSAPVKFGSAPNHTET